MGKRQKKTENAQSREAKSSAEGSGKIAGNGAGGGGGAPTSRGLAGWWRSKGPVFRFVAGFAMLVGSFAIFFFAYFTNTEAFDDYLRLNATASAAVINLFDDDVRASEFSVISSKTSVQIRHGCDAIFPAALFVGAVLASPVRFRAKLPGIFIGTVVLLSINLLRIISLYYTRVYKPDWFHMMHIDVWQPLFIFLALLFWVLWALRATRHTEEPA